MRLATYNVENLFDRPKAMNLGSWSEGKPTLEKFAQLNALLGEITYTPPRKRKMVELMIELGLERSDTGPFVLLRRNRGKLLKRPRDPQAGALEIIANGRADWAGSLELIDEPVDEEAMRNTARVINDVNADVLAVIEAENRPVLVDFSEELLQAMGGTPYRHVMLIDGNDARGIDVGLMTRIGWRIGVMRSHVDDRLPNGTRIFSRDCPEFEVLLPDGRSLWVLVNHFKSKGYGGKAASDARRKAQATQTKVIYERLVQSGEELVAVVGDLNDTPDSDPLSPLLAGTDLRDVSVHPNFEDEGFPGTYGASKAGNKIDYLLLSPALFDRVQAGGAFRKGMWPGVRPAKWPVYAELTKAEHAASDHAALWVDLEL
jgi:endonuclease/exonuclease/phosphatase family metal-dependent hydrolase